MQFKKSILAAAIALSTFASGAANATAVGLELSLVIDVSGSINTTEYNLQRNGYKAAFLDSAVQSALLSYAPAGGVAVNVIQFASNAQQVIGWTLLTNATQINNFANALGNMGRSNHIGTDTDVQDGMDLAIDSIINNGYHSGRMVIDVSGDGAQNDGPDCDFYGPSYNQACAAVQAERNQAAANGITVNGLAIEGAAGANGITSWYNANVRTGNGFVITANDFDDFERAAIEKIGREVGKVPAPAALLLAGIGMMGVGFARRRRVAA